MMKIIQPCFLILFIIPVSQICCERNYDSIELESIGQNDAVSRETMAAYNFGVHMGIIKPEKYCVESFKRDEENHFKYLYKEYISLNISRPVNYLEWLVINNFGILPDTQESLLDIKITRRHKKDNKRLFLKSVKKGDILISGSGRGGLVGHAAIMVSDFWVLDMPGGKGWARGINDNNRQIGKDEWYDEFKSDWITVYRCPDKTSAKQAAEWADHYYFNPSGGSTKTTHIKYLVTTDNYSTNPSYSSKLVIQSYYFGPEKNVLKDISTITDIFIAPAKIPSYFRSKYKPENIGKF